MGCGVHVSDTIRTYVINLERRPDRRTHMERCLPAPLMPIFTSDWPDEFDGLRITRDGLDAAGVGLFAWRVKSDNPWWSRPLKLGEIGCTLAHWSCWRDAHNNGSEPYVLVLEDDAVPAPDMLDRLLGTLDCLGPDGFDLLYLGRYPLEPDQPAAPGLVVPGYSHCTFGYLLTRRALRMLLPTRLDQAIVPIDEFLPAMYIDHPRVDVRGRFPRKLRALAFDPPLATQLPKATAGSDTEASPFVDW